MLFLLLGPTRQVCFKNVAIVIERKCHDKVSDQELSATKNGTNNGPPTVWISPLIVLVVYVTRTSLTDLKHQAITDCFRWWSSRDAHFAALAFRIGWEEFLRHRAISNPGSVEFQYPLASRLEQVFFRTGWGVRITDRRKHRAAPFLVNGEFYGVFLSATICAGRHHTRVSRRYSFMPIGISRGIGAIHI